MTDTIRYHLKMKIGTNEFEAEGPREIVEAQFAAWKELVASAPVTPTITPTEASSLMLAELSGGLPAPIPATLDTKLDKIMKLDGRVISLTARPKSSDDAVLLLLYGQKALRDNDSVTGAEVWDGVKATGALDIKRVDRLLEKLGSQGDVIVIGERRAKRYRLTNTGLAKARQAATDLLATVA